MTELNNSKNQEFEISLRNSLREISKYHIQEYHRHNPAVVLAYSLRVTKSPVFPFNDAFDNDLTYNSQPSEDFSLASNIISYLQSKRNSLETPEHMRFIVRNYINPVKPIRPAGSLGLLVISSGFSSGYWDNDMYSVDEIGNGIITAGLTQNRSPLWVSANYPFNGENFDYSVNSLDNPKLTKLVEKLNQLKKVKLS